jgi:hypothetical protein
MMQTGGRIRSIQGRNEKKQARGRDKAEAKIKGARFYALRLFCLVLQQDSFFIFQAATGGTIVFSELSGPGLFSAEGCLCFWQIVLLSRQQGSNNITRRTGRK